MFRQLAAACAALSIMGAQAAAAPLEAYGRLPAVEGVEISADGSNIAYIRTEGANRLVIVQSLEGEALQVVQLGEAKVRNVEWAGADHVLIVTSSTDAIPQYTLRGELFQAASLNIHTGKVTHLISRTQDKKSALTIMFGELTPGSHKGQDTVFLTTYSPDYGWVNLYRVDLDTGAAFLQEMGEDLLWDFLTLPDGSTVAKSTYRHEDGLWRLYIKNGSAYREVYRTTALIERSDIVGLTEDGSALIVGEWDDQEQLWRPIKVSLGDGSRGEPFLPAKSLGVMLDRNKRMIGYVHAETFDKHVFTQPQLAAAWAMVTKLFGDRQISLESFSDDFNKLIVHVNGSGEPGNFYLIDLSTKKVKLVARSYPEIPANEIAEVRLLQYNAADGLAIPAFLTLPPGREPKNLPLIVLPHGGPQSHDEPGFDWWAQALASRGYAVLQPNFRGSSGYGRDFIEAAYGEWGRKMQTDLSDGVRYLAGRQIIDPKRVCIAGGSYGGYAALAGITLDKGVYRCAASINGVSDPESMLERIISRGGREQAGVRYWFRYMGVNDPDEPKLREVSPVRFAAAADGPILLIHGKDDTVVDYGQTSMMAAALKKFGKNHEVVTMAGEDHWLSMAVTRQQMLSSLVAFLEKHNPPN